ncbi:MAG: PKD domain-containing protein [bacterium]|nr:PKD domain-containing protein [bacterium]
MKNAILKLGSIFFIFYTIVSTAVAKNYYIKISGSDIFNGQSVNGAWATIAKVNATTFSAGDSVFFEGGRTFTGNIYLSPSSKGTPKNPIVVSSYGSGRATILASNGHGFLAYNNSGIEVHNLIFIGSGASSNTGTGVYFYMDDTTNIKRKHIEVHNVEASGFYAAGIQIGSYAKNGSRSGYDSVKINACYAHHNGLCGISMYGNYKVTDTAYSHKNIWITRCIAAHNDGVLGYSTHSGNGIIIGQADTCIMEYCEAYENGKNNNYPGGGPAGIWAWDSRSVMIQFCYSHHNRSQTGDGDGFDLDGGVQYSTMQYNYAHNNDGPGFLIAQFAGARKMKNNVVRYNISERDGKGLGILVWSGDPPGQITAQKIDVYNNTVFVDTIGSAFANGAIAVFNNYGAMKDIRICNNIFLTKNGAVTVNLQKTLNLKFYNNAYYDFGQGTKFIDRGATYSSMVAWRGGTGQEVYNGKSVGFKNDPLLIDPGNAGAIANVDSLTSIEAYRYQGSSIHIGKGIIIDTLIGFNNLIRDFYNDTMALNNQFSPGAHEIDLPKAQFSASNTCQGAITKFINRSLKSQSYFWRFGDGTTSTAFSIDHMYNTVGKYTVTLIVYGKFGYSDSIKRIIEILETPVVTFSAVNSIYCQQTAVEFNNTTLGNVNFLWTFDDSTTDVRINPTHVFKYPGYHKVKLKATSFLNCKDSLTTTYQFFARPKAAFFFNGNCPKSKTTFSNQSIGESFYDWQFGDTFISALKNPVHTYNFAGNKTVTLIVSSSNFCTDTIQKNILINSLPVANFMSYDHCFGDTIPLFNNSINDSSYLWLFDDGNTSNSITPKYKYTNAGSYQMALYLVNKAGCKDSISKAITVNALPNAHFTFKHLNDSIYLMASDTTLNNYHWSVDLVVLNQNKAKLGYRLPTKGIHKIRLQATNINGCRSDSSETVDNTVGLYTMSKLNPFLNFYPNPFSSVFTLDYRHKNAAMAYIKIQNIEGQNLYNFSLSTESNGVLNFKFDCNEYPLSDGVYLVNLLIDGVSLTKQLIHQK